MLSVCMCVCVCEAKYIAQIVVAGAQIVGRAFIKALRTEVHASQQAAQARSSSGKTNVRSAAADALTGMTLQVLLFCLLGFSLLSILADASGHELYKSSMLPPDSSSHQGISSTSLDISMTFIGCRSWNREVPPVGPGVALFQWYHISLRVVIKRPHPTLHPCPSLPPSNTATSHVAPASQSPSFRHRNIPRRTHVPVSLLPTPQHPTSHPRPTYLFTLYPH